MTTFILLGAMSASAKSAMTWQCSGQENFDDIHVTFDVIFAEHDGRDYQYKAIEQLNYDGIIADPIPLSNGVFICGKDDEGHDRVGRQEWSFAKGRFYFYQGCENEAIEIEGDCTP